MTAVTKANVRNTVDSVPGLSPTVLSVPGMMNSSMPIIISADIARAKPERLGVCAFCFSVMSSPFADASC